MTLKVNSTAVGKDTPKSWPTHDEVINGGEERLDYFTTRDDIEFAGTHFIVDLWGADRLDDLQLMEETMRKAVIEAGATLLHIHLHYFTPNGGISGVAVLAESHISVHTWPERNFAAFDIFMCGGAKPELTIPVIERAYTPDTMNVTEHLRGRTVEVNVDDTHSG